LIDPVFADRASPFSWAGPRRVHPPGIALHDLPPITAILLSHDHYDHCDKRSLRELAQTHPQSAFICPLGNGEIARRCGFESFRIVELDWWDGHELAPELHVQATPARHWSNRIKGPRNGRLWSGFFIQAGGRTAYCSGDTAWDDELFAEVNRRCGAPDLGIIPIGAYEPRWFMESQHCNPEEAVRIHRTVGAKRSLGVHWGTFQLTDEGREEPVTALGVARAAAGLSPGEFITLDPGDSILI
jgi:L-ascorbate metabolism protein UlaG (beta-lactamase superfamily)